MQSQNIGNFSSTVCVFELHMGHYLVLEQDPYALGKSACISIKRFICVAGFIVAKAYLFQ
jgi:hypothetical protein